MFRDRNKASHRPSEPPEGGAGGVDPAPSPADSGGGDGHAIEELLAKIEALTAERDEAKTAYLRALADFQNYQRRSHENEREAKRQGVTALVLGVVPVIDHFDMALGHDPEKMTAQQVVNGVKVIREELLKVLAAHGVTQIDPAPNEELDPKRHHAVLHQPIEGVEPGRISRTLQVGYALGDRVIRPANVAVAP